MAALKKESESASDFRVQFAANLINRLSKNPDISSFELVTHYVYAMQMKFHHYLITINPSMDTLFTQEDAVYSKWTEELNQVLTDNDLPWIESFAIAKYTLDQLFLKITENGSLEYTYHKNALITSQMLQESLGVSRATVSRYVEAGMEVVAGVGHHCYPLHNTFYWSNGIWAAKIQSHYQTYRLRSQTERDVIKELKEEIQFYQDKYNGTLEDIFKNTEDPDQLIEPEDYFHWQSAIEELRRILNE